MIIYSIYKATNKINGKCYIGFDSNWPHRKKHHKINFKNKSEKRIVFYDAIRKYGWDNFQWEVIYQSLDYEHTLNVMENYFIVENRSYAGFQDCNGYNATLGGDGVKGFKQSPETIEKKTGENHWNYGNRHSLETRQKMKNYANNMSPEHRRKLSEAKKGNKNASKHKSVV